MGKRGRDQWERVKRGGACARPCGRARGCPRSRGRGKRRPHGLRTTAPPIGTNSSTVIRRSVRRRGRQVVPHRCFRLTEGGEYPAATRSSGSPAVDVEGGTLSWAADRYQFDPYDVAAVVMKGGSGAMVYYYDASGKGLDDSDAGLTTPINTNGEPIRGRSGSATSTSASTRRLQGVDDLVVTKTAQTTWEKVYTWEVEKSVDRPQLQLQSGGSGTVNGRSTSPRAARLRGTQSSRGRSRREPQRRGGHRRGVSDALAGAVVDCDAGAAGAQSTGLTVPGNGSLSCTYSAARETTDGGTNTASAAGSLNGVDVSGTGRRTSRSETPNYEVNKAVKAVDGKNTWSDITGTTSFTYDEEFPCPEPGPDERRRAARRQPGDRAGRDGSCPRHRLGERDGHVRQHAASTASDRRGDRGKKRQG